VYRTRSCARRTARCSPFIRGGNDRVRGSRQLPFKQSPGPRWTSSRPSADASDPARPSLPPRLITGSSAGGFHGRASHVWKASEKVGAVQQDSSGKEGAAMRGLFRHALVAAGVSVVLLIPAAGLASTSSTVVLIWSPTTSAGTYNYGTLNPGQTASQTLTLTNSGTAASAALKITLTGSSAFTKIGDTCTG